VICKVGAEARLRALRVLRTAVICTDASLFKSSVAVSANCGALVGGLVKLVLEKTLMAISTAGSNIHIAGGEASPDGRERQEDADDGGALGGELGHSVIELEAGEDG